MKFLKNVRVRIFHVETKLTVNCYKHYIAYGNVLELYSLSVTKSMTSQEFDY